MLGPGSAEKVPPLLRTLGEPLQVAAAGAANAGPDEGAHQREGHEGPGHVDRLAVSVRCGRLAGQVSLHAAVHVPVCVLYGGWLAEGSVRVSAGESGDALSILYLYYQICN